jgi:hypothetical protein
MYVNAKIIPVDTVQGFRGRGDEREQLREKIQV